MTKIMNYITISLAASLTLIGVSINAFAQETQAHSTLPQLESHTFASQIFWLFVAFVLMYFVFAQFVLPKTKFMLDVRQRKIDDDIELAKKLVEESETYSLHAQQQQHDYLDKAKDIIAKAQKQYSQSMAEREAELMKEFQEKIASVDSRVSHQKNIYYHQIHDVCMILSQDIIYKLSGMRVSEEEIKSELQQQVNINELKVA